MADWDEIETHDYDAARGGESGGDDEWGEEPAALTKSPSGPIHLGSIGGPSANFDPSDTTAAGRGDRLLQIAALSSLELPTDYELDCVRVGHVVSCRTSNCV